MPEYTRNHYVPEWYQKHFIPDDLKERKFNYLDLNPEKISNKGHTYTQKPLRPLGAKKCFCENDLYTTMFGKWKSTEIEEKFFGKIDLSGSKAVAYFTSFQHPNWKPQMSNALVSYMSIQKLRTPKGLAYLSDITNLNDKNIVLLEMQKLQQMFCAIWTECIWSIADASNAETKFIISDHPVTVYNMACFPASKWCRGFKDPDIRLSGSHTLFPFNLNKILILTNLSWIRNPYMDPLKERPNPSLFRSALFNWQQIQTGRMLTDLEVNEINFIIKKRAYRYIAAAKKEWLYPEEKISTQHWNKIGKGYLLMPDPRSITFSSEVVFGYKNNKTDSFDAHGRKPWQAGYDKKKDFAIEWNASQAFQAEYARIIGPKRKGQSYEYGQLDIAEDSPENHTNTLRQEGFYKNKLPDKYRKRRRNKK